MGAPPVIQPNFAAGEISPSVYGHIDLAKYHAGVALCRNFFVDYRGGLINRSGTRFVCRCKDSATKNRLIPFRFSILQAYVLLLGNQTLRVIMNGGLVLEPSTSITGISQANPGVVTDIAHGFSNGDTIFLDAVGGMTALNNSFYLVAGATTDTYTLTDLDGNAIDTSALPAYTSGGTAARVFTLATPYADTDLALLKYSQSKDTLNFTHPDYPPMQLTRTQHYAWQLMPTLFVPGIDPPTGITVTTSDSGGSTTYQYVVTALGANGVTESIASALGSVTDSTAMSTNVGVYVTTGWDPVIGATQYNIYRTVEVRNDGTPPDGSLLGFIGSAGPDATAFIDNNITPDFSRTPPMFNNPFDPTGVGGVTITSGGSGYTSPPKVTFTGGGGSDAAGIGIVQNGKVVRIVLEDEGTGYTSVPTTVFTGGGGSGAAGTAILTTLLNNPSCSNYFQGRLWYAATTAAVDELAASRSSDYNNFGFSIPERDDDAILVQLVSQQVNAIKHLLSLNSLLALTSSGAWKIDGGNVSDAVTPSAIDAVPQAYSGCSDVRPLIVNYDILYVQEMGSFVRDLTYNFYVNLYTGTDISLLSNHLFSTRTITEWDFAEEPHKTVWAVCDDGILLSLTFLKEQDVYGWARHDTQNGRFKSVACIPEDDETATYFVVERVINGQTLQYVERLQSRELGGDIARGIPGDLDKAWFVDCGLKYPQVFPAATLTPVLTQGEVVPVSQIVGASIVVGGSGYVAPVLAVSDPGGGTGAVLSADVTAGAITGITVVSAGSGYVNPSITVSDAAGSGAVLYPIFKNLLTLNASAAVFNGGTIGNFVRVNGGYGIVYQAPSSAQIIVDIKRPLTSMWPALSGEWSCTQGVASVSGLDHLEGQTVSILANGSVQPQAVVMDGTVVIGDGSQLYDSIVVGIPIQAQVKTLYLAMGSEPTEQSRRKKLPAVTVRLKDTRGLKIGTDFDDLLPMKQRYAESLGEAIQLFTGDLRTVISPSWNLYGQVAVQQDDPLPAHLLAVIPEVVVGDTIAR